MKNINKTIFACYEEIKQREIMELEVAVRNAGSVVTFNEGDAPIVMCNFNGFSPHPADVRITRVILADEEDEDVLHIYGQEKCEGGCAAWYEDEREISLTDIAYGHIQFITDSIQQD